LKRSLAFLGAAFFSAAIQAAGQAAQPTSPADPTPSAPAPDALAVRVHAAYLVADGAGAASGAAPAMAPWEAQSVKYTTLGALAPFKLLGPNIVVFIGLTPFARKEGDGVILVAEGQVGVKRSDGGFSYQATVSKIDVGYGENVLFFPLGLKSPLRVEIAIFRAADLPAQGAMPDSAAQPPGAAPAQPPVPQKVGK
jgi:hypothetical protein